MVELYIRYIDEDMRVGSGAYDRLVALREHPRVVWVGLGIIIVGYF